MFGFLKRLLSGQSNLEPVEPAKRSSAWTGRRPERFYTVRQQMPNTSLQEAAATLLAAFPGKPCSCYARSGVCPVCRSRLQQEQPTGPNA